MRHCAKNMKTVENCIISSDLPKDVQNNFPIIDVINNKVGIVQKEFSLQREESIPVILCHTDFAFMESHMSSFYLQDDTIFGISAILHANEISMHTTGQCLATKRDTPRGVRQSATCNVKESIMNKFWSSLKVYPNINKVSLEAKAGLKDVNDGEECIAKYGSIWKSKLFKKIKIQ